MSLSTSRVIQVKIDVLHVLNDIHNNPSYIEIGSIITPQGLIALLLSLAPTPGWSEECLAILESYDPTCISNHKHLDELQILLEQIVQEIDVQTSLMFQKYHAQTTPHFNGWSGLSCLSLIASTCVSEQTSVQEYSKGRAGKFRYYDGYHA